MKAFATGCFDECISRLDAKSRLEKKREFQPSFFFGEFADNSG